MVNNILIIKHGSLGDWIMATGAFKAVRDKYPNAHITLLTSSPYKKLAKQSKLFNEIWVDNRKPFYCYETWMVIKKLRSIKFDFVFDFQCSSRTQIYYFLMHGYKCNWSGRAKFCSHFTPFDTSKHIVEMFHKQLQLAGIKKYSGPDLKFLKADISNVLPKGKFVLFVPGSSAKHKNKRWNSSGYARVVDWLHTQGIKSVLTGTNNDNDIINEIIELSTHKAINIINKAGFAEMASLARHAVAAIGSDTGPMHIIAATQCPSLVLFSSASSPHKTKPCGDNVRVIQRPDLNDLKAKTVTNALQKLL